MPAIAPATVIEAMAASLPIAATGVGDVAAIVAAENQPFITPLDDGALAAAMTTLARDARLRERIGMANRNEAEATFGESAMVSAWDALLQGR